MEVILLFLIGIIGSPYTYFVHESEGDSLHFAFYSVASILVATLLFTLFFWLGDMQGASPWLAGFVFALFWFFNNGWPVFGSALCAGLVQVALTQITAMLVLVLSDPLLSAITAWANELTLSTATISFAALYFLVTWPLAALRQAIWPNQ